MKERGRRRIIHGLRDCKLRPPTTRWVWLTSEAGSAHVLELLLVELPLLAVERQRTAPAVVGGAQSDHLLIRPLQEVSPWFVLEIKG